jgi:hypothetical protein
MRDSCAINQEMELIGEQAEKAAKKDGGTDVLDFGEGKKCFLMCARYAGSRPSLAVVCRLRWMRRQRQ